MRAVLGDVVLAQAPQEELVKIEGNWYFPPERVDFSLLAQSPTPYTCPWKGAVQYYSVLHGDDVLADRAWAYPNLLPGAAEKAGKDFAGYVAFWKEVEVVD